jgi:hypothetical protein
MNMTATNHFLKFHALGYERLCPIVPVDAKISDGSTLKLRLNTPKDPRGKAPGLRNRQGEWHGYDFVKYENDEYDLTRWSNWGAGVGIKTGQGLVMIDADTTNAEWAEVIRDEVAAIIPLSSVRVGQYPKAGYIVRTDPDFIYSSIGFGERDGKNQFIHRVEILAEGKQFVAHGTHPKTLKPYTWPKGIPAYAELPFVSGDDLLALLARLAAKLPASSRVITEGGGDSTIDQESLKGDLELVRKAVRATPNTDELFPRREDYRDFGYAIKAALQDHRAEAEDLFKEWCEGWVGPKGEVNEKNIIEADWKRMKPPFRRGAKFIFEKAEELSQGKFSTAEVWFDALPDPEVDLNPFKDLEQKQAEKPAKKFVFMDFDEVAAVALEQSNRPLVKGFIDQGTMSVIYGDSNVGKTFVAMDLAFHIGAGIDYAGMKTTQGLVVYVAAEGGNGAKRRVLALKEKYGAKADGAQFKLLPSPIDLRRPDADLNAFIEALRGVGAPISLIVVDTLSRALAGGDENSSVDMGAIVKHFDVIRNATGAHLMIVHHTGKNKAAGARGHSLLRAATDTEIEVTEGQIAVTKQRDLDKSWTSGFSLEVKTLGIDEDLDPITSCTVRLLSREEVEAEERKGEPTVAEARVLRGLAFILVGSSLRGQGVTLEQLMSSSADILTGMNAELVRAHLRNLKVKGYVTQPKRGFWGLKDDTGVTLIEDSVSKKQGSEKEDLASSEYKSEEVGAVEVEEIGRKRKESVFD